MATIFDSCTDLIPNLVWIVPIAGAALSVLFASVGGKARDAIAVGTGLVTALLATSLFFLPEFSKFTLTGNIYDDFTLCGRQATWIQALNLKAGVLVDPLTGVLALTVSWVSFLILVYSLGYMHGERNLTRYYFLMNFFIGNMLLLVMSDNFLQLFLGWEGVGYCSYALIGFWHTDESKYWVGTLGEKTAAVPEAYSPTHAGLKAFIMTRAGDIAFLIGILMIFAYSGTFNFLQLSVDLKVLPNWASSLSSVGLFVPSGLLIFGGAIGKSAQFPLHEWLPDAMAGPTSVSALIHAATMVNAGVFLVGTVGPLYLQAATILNESVYPFFVVVAAIGTFTALLAASQAMVLDELKKVLAYSTVSQIGYMMLGLGVAGLSVSQTNFSYGYTAGFFHLISQALFKAALFMCAGWLIHATGSKFMSEMGGLRGKMKITFFSMLIASLSLAGIFPLSGFWSKDSILGAALQSGGIALIFYGLGLTVALMTAFYSMRMIGLIFMGNKSTNVESIESHEESAHHLTDPSFLWWVPYSLLAAATVVVGIVAPIFLQQDLGGLFSSYLSFFGISSPYKFSIQNEAFGLIVGLSVSIIGVLIGYAAYVRRSISPTAFVASSPVTRGFYKFFQHRWYINAFYYKVFVYPVKNGSSWIFRNFEQKIIDPINYAAPEFGGGVSDVLRKIQTGIEEEYVFAFGVGIVMLIVLLLLFAHI